jgi:DNA-binding NarL/FixJ family response regulator
MILVAICAADAAMRDGIASLLEDTPGIDVVGMDVVGMDVVGMDVVGAAENEAGLVGLLESMRVDVVVMALEPDATPAAVHGLAEDIALIALVADRAGAVAALQGGARAVLVRPAERAEIVAAVQAVASGLSVLPADLLDGLLQPGGSDNATAIATADGEALTQRELEVLALIAAGASNKLIARRLGISVHTAKFHVAGILEKLAAGSRAEAVAIAARLGLVLL